MNKENQRHRHENEHYSKEAEVLYSLRSLTGDVKIEGTESGSSVGSLLLETIMDNQSKVIIHFGQPGTGKTTLIGQEIYEINRLTNGRIKTENYFFDDYLQKFRREKNILHLNPALGTELSKGLLLDLKKHVPKKHENKKLFVELPAVGNIDVGRSTLDKLIEDPKLKEQMVIVGLVPDIRTQTRTADIRDFIEQAQPRDLVKDIREKYGIIVVSKHDNNRIGEAIKYLGKGMAAATIIKRVKTEVITEARERIKEDIPFNMELKDYLDTIIPDLPGQEELNSDKEIEEYKLQAYSMKARRKDYASDNMLILMGPFQKTIHWHI